MMRSLYSGVAGLKTHQTKMDVIGNNIANVNTTSYKASSITFSELMSQTTQKASGPNATTGVGGTNARQIGLGVKTGAININITGQGSSQSTGNPFDIMITGDNFFVVNNGLENFFTRDGSFYVDGAGNLAMTSIGYNVMGWQVDEETGKIKQDTVAALRIMNAANMQYPPEATSKAYMSGILDSDDPDVTSSNGKSINLNFFDNLGYNYTAKFVLKQSNNKHQFSVELDRILDANGEPLDLSKINSTQALFGDAAKQEKTGKVSFDAVGYEWKSGVLYKGTKIVADVTKMFDATGNPVAGDIVIDTSTTPQTTATYDDQMDAIAKAYGYEGSTKDFLNLIYAAPKDPSDPAQGTTPINILTMIKNLKLTPNGVGDQTALPVFTGVKVDEANFAVTGREYEGVSLEFNEDTGYFKSLSNLETKQTETLRMSLFGGNFNDIEIDFADLVNFGNKGTSTAGATSGDQDGLGMGRKLGKMIGLSVQKDGMIYASYDNGMTKLLGQIATAAFANASGLERAGDNLYSATMNSGEFDGVGVDVTANGGYMSTEQLEMSNVDLSSEFTEMITTQRGFQANSRIITVSDTLLEELTNLKR